LEGNLAGDACGDWTSSGDGSAMVGHQDRTGGGVNPESWGFAHASKGCGLEVFILIKIFVFICFSGLYLQFSE